MKKETLNLLYPEFAGKEEIITHTNGEIDLNKIFNMGLNPSNFIKKPSDYDLPRYFGEDFDVLSLDIIKEINDYPIRHGVNYNYFIDQETGEIKCKTQQKEQNQQFEPDHLFKKIKSLFKDDLKIIYTPRGYKFMKEIKESGFYTLTNMVDEAMRSENYLKIFDSFFTTLTKHDRVDVRQYLASKGIKTRTLLKDKETSVLLTLAEHGYHHNVLIKNKVVRYYFRFPEEDLKKLFNFKITTPRLGKELYCETKDEVEATINDERVRDGSFRYNYTKDDYKVEEIKK